MKEQNKKLNPEVKTFDFEGREVRAVMIDDVVWFIGKDTAQALGYNNTNKALKDHVDLEDKKKGVTIRYPLGGIQKPVLINELGVYSLIFNSKLPTAKDFKRFVLETIQSLRKAAGLESYEAFRMMDKEIQKAATDRLYKITHPESNVPVIKANAITNKAIANMYGEPKAIPKGKMTPEMLKDRQPIYDDTINLMIAQQAFDLDISISKAVYEKYSEKKAIKIEEA